MHFEFSFKTDLPVDFVYHTIRDDLPRIVDYCRNIEKIEVLERHETRDAVFLVNKWHGRDMISTILKTFMGGDKIAWIGRAEWLKREYVCDWSFEPFVFKNNLTINGRDSYTSDGMGTKIVLAGEVETHFNSYVLLPSLFGREIAAVALAAMKPNFADIVTGLEKYVRYNKLVGNL